MAPLFEPHLYYSHQLWIRYALCAAYFCLLILFFLGITLPFRRYWDKLDLLPGLPLLARLSFGPALISITTTFLLYFSILNETALLLFFGIGATVGLYCIPTAINGCAQLWRHYRELPRLGQLFGLFALLLLLLNGLHSLAPSAGVDAYQQHFFIPTQYLASNSLNIENPLNSVNFHGLETLYVLPQCLGGILFVQLTLYYLFVLAVFQIALLSRVLVKEQPCLPIISACLFLFCQFFTYLLWWSKTELLFPGYLSLLITLVVLHIKKGVVLPFPFMAIFCSFYFSSKITTIMTAPVFLLCAFIPSMPKRHVLGTMALSVVFLYPWLTLTWGFIATRLPGFQYF